MPDQSKRAEVSAEMMAKLPYQGDDAATVVNVVDEFTKLIALVSGVVAMSPRFGAQMVWNGTKEPGTSIVVQKMRVGLALESWAGEAAADLIKIMAESFGGLSADG